MDNLTKSDIADIPRRSEFQSFRKYIDERLKLIEEKLWGRDPALPIKLDDLDQEILNIFNSLSGYYKKGEQMREADLPTNAATKNYVNNRTKGILYDQVTAPPIIDEVVEARDGDVNLKTQVQRYSKKVNLITDINDLTTGEINKERQQTRPHNDLANRDASDCHPESAITNLTTDLSGKVDKTSVIQSINDSEELNLDGETFKKIILGKLEIPAHNDLTLRDAEGCHPITSITGLDAELIDLNSELDTLSNKIAGWETLATSHGYTSFEDMLSCLYQATDNLLTDHPTDEPICWTDL